MIEDYIHILKRANIFRNIEEKDLVTLLSCLDMKTKEYKKGCYVVEQGEKMGSLAILLEGAMLIQSDDFWGNRSIIGKISAGDTFGEAYAFSNTQEAFNDVVATENCVVAFIDAKHALTSCTSNCIFHAIFIQNIFRIIAEKNQKLVLKLEHVSRRSTREKLISYLSEEARIQKKSHIIIPFNRQQLADFLFVDRSAMSNELSKMRDEGLIDFDKNSFTLKKLL